MTSSATITFALVREGPTDDGIVRLIREVITSSAGDRIDTVVGESRSYTGRPATQVSEVVDEQGTPIDLLFVHHDSDSRDHTATEAEILAAAEHFPDPARVVGVIPVQETEAWMLADEELIQSVVGRSRTTLTRQDLGIPPLRRVETTPSPKEVLEEALVLATKETRRARKRTRDRFSDHRAAILDFLDIDGPLALLESWQRFREETSTAVSRILTDREL